MPPAGNEIMPPHVREFPERIKMFRRIIVTLSDTPRRYVGRDPIHPQLRQDNARQHDHRKTRRRRGNSLNRPATNSNSTKTICGCLGVRIASSIASAQDRPGGGFPGGPEAKRGDQTHSERPPSPLRTRGYRAYRQHRDQNERPFEGRSGRMAEATWP